MKTESVPSFLLSRSTLRKLTWAALALGAAFALTAAMIEPANATVTRVGNGDDGGDLEGGDRVTSGILIETRNKALARLKSLGTGSVEHLGTLIPELEKSEILLVNRNITPKLKEDSGLEGSPDGKFVYARTFAEPHAATRFFPAALMLNEEQLISLHVHEALHRSLPAHVRENEEIVTRITLAITAADASVDRVKQTVASAVGVRGGIVTASANSGALTTGNGPVTIIVNGPVDGPVRLQSRSEVPEAPPIERPSSVTYGFRSFMIPDRNDSMYPVTSLHSLQSFLYPFGTGSRAFGLGLEFTYLQTPEQAYLGPLEISARLRLASIRGFDISAFGRHSLYTTAAGELKNSPLGRDVTTVGVSMRKDTSTYYVENSLAISGQGEAKETIGRIDYTHEYGTVTAAAIRAGGKVGLVQLGGFAEILLSDGYRLRGGAFNPPAERFRIIGIGPEAALEIDALRFALTARWMIDSTEGVNLDYLGDILGHGVGQGFVGSSLSLRF